MDDRILEGLHMDGNVAQHVVVKNDGGLAIGKYKSGWVNNLFNSYYYISFFEVVQRIAFIITGGNSNNCDKDGLVGFIQEAIDKVLKKDEKEKVIELLLHYSTLISEDSPLKITYNTEKDDPGFNKNKGTCAKQRMVGVADAIIDFGNEQIPVQLHVDIKQTSNDGWVLNQTIQEINTTP